MPNLREFFAGLAAHPLRRRIGSDQLRMFGFQGDQRVHQLVEFGVADLRIVKHVVAVLVVANLVPQRVNSVLHVFAGGRHSPIIGGKSRLGIAVVVPRGGRAALQRGVKVSSLILLSWLQRLLKKALAFVLAARRGHFSRVERPFSIAFLSLQELFSPCRHTTPSTYCAGISFCNFTMRTRLLAVASRRNNQSTRFTPCNLSLRMMLSSLPQPNTISTSLRFFWLMAILGSLRSASVRKLGQWVETFSYSATCGAMLRSRSAAINFSS